MLCSKRKCVSVIFVLCLTCALFVFASEHSHSIASDASSQDVCVGNKCVLNDAGSSSSVSDVMSANRNILPIHIMITFTNAEYKGELRAKFAVTVSSLFQHSTRPVTLHVIGDAASQLLAKNILSEHVKEPDKYKVRRIFVL